MATVDDVLERLVNDPEFREQLASDQEAALAGYDLSEEDRALLTSTLTEGAGASGGMEARQSKSALAGVVDTFTRTAQGTETYATTGGDDSAASGNVAGPDLAATDPGSPSVPLGFDPNLWEGPGYEEPPKGSPIDVRGSQNGPYGGVAGSGQDSGTDTGTDSPTDSSSEAEEQPADPHIVKHATPEPPADQEGA